MQSIATASDWMVTVPTTRDAKSDAAAERLGAVALLTNELQRSEMLVLPASAAFRAVRDKMATLPPQIAGVDPDSPFAVWMSIAAQAEHDGAYRLAQLIVDAVRERVHTLRDDARDQAAVDQYEEWIAICWARRGRIARMYGAFDDAFACYSQAAESAERRPWIDAGPQAELGLATLAAVRGNFPEVERRASSLIARRPQLFAVYRVHAHQFLSLAQRKRGAFIDALLSAWASYDLLSTEDFRRHELICVMSEIALELGDIAAAARGFQSVLEANVTARIRVPALAGAVHVCARELGTAASTGKAPRLSTLAAQLQHMLTDSLSPNDRATVLVSLSDAAIALGDFNVAEHWLRLAADTASESNLFERQFQIEAQRESLRTFRDGMVSAASTADAARVTGRASYDIGSSASASATAPVSRHPALARLEQCALSGSSDLR